MGRVPLLDPPEIPGRGNGATPSPLHCYSTAPFPAAESLPFCINTEFWQFSWKKKKTTKQLTIKRTSNPRNSHF